MNLILCGLPGSGKSTTGKLLAEKWGWQTLETDKELERHYAESSHEVLTCREIYKKIGEKEFRQLENKILSSLSVERHIIDIGGGTLNDPANIKAVKALGSLVYLDVSDKEKLYLQMTHKGMPAYLDKDNPFTSFLKLVVEREAIYEQAADIKIDVTGLKPTEIVDKITGSVKHGS